MFSPLLALEWSHYLFSIPLCLISVFLILVILVQRGRGGGLTGALGGMGGQSAFGTKAGDLFTKITIAVAAIWILLSMAALKVLNTRSATAGLTPGTRAPLTPGTEPAKGTTATTPATTNSSVPPPIPAGEKASPATDGKPATDTAPASTPPSSDTTPAPTTDSTSSAPATPNE